MSTFGRNPYPRRMGGGKHTIQQEHEAALAALESALDVSSDTATYAEAYAYALAVSYVWALSARLANQAIPSEMLENLTTWERACRLRPTPNDSVIDRRARVAAKLRGLSGNTRGDIWDSCSELLGENLDTLLEVPEAGVVSFWPGVNPGPPGFEWSSNRANIAVRMTRGNLTDSDFVELRNRCAQMLDAMLPAWARYSLGVGSSFICNQGIVGQTFL